MDLKIEIQCNNEQHRTHIILINASITSSSRILSKIMTANLRNAHTCTHWVCMHACIHTQFYCTYYTFHVTICTNINICAADVSHMQNTLRLRRFTRLCSSRNQNRANININVIMQSKYHWNCAFGTTKITTISFSADKCGCCWSLIFFNVILLLISRLDVFAIAVLTL